MNILRLMSITLFAIGVGVQFFIFYKIVDAKRKYGVYYSKSKYKEMKACKDESHKNVVNAFRRIRDFLILLKLIFLLGFILLFIS